MEQNYWMLVPMALPILAGLCMLCLPVFKKNGLARRAAAAAALLLHTVVVWMLILKGGSSLLLFHLTDKLPVYFRIDGVSALFAGLTSFIWLMAGLFAFGYMKHEEREEQYFGCFLLVLGILTGLDLSGNLITMYLFYELMTVSSFPLVFHSRTHEAVMAGLKYLFYSIAGAFLALFGIFFLYSCSDTLAFTAGGVLDPELFAGREGIVLLAVFCTLVGFGAKAGMFPLHSWLPAAHPVAPAPASAVFSGIITKSGVLAIIRVVYFIAGTELLRGTWVHQAWLALILITVIMGSLMAYKEPVFKKRLAYSTVSQVSYILYGLAVLTPHGLMGGMSHIVYHSFIKNALFLVAGAIIVQTGRTRVEQFRGIGKEMPVTMWCYTIVSLALVGIPPLSGFVSKYWLMEASLSAELGVFSWLGPVVLLLSALLTAGYLLPVTVMGFFPGPDYAYGELEHKEPCLWMLLPIVALTALTVLFGIWGAAPDAGGLMGFLSSVADGAF